MRRRAKLNAGGPRLKARPIATYALAARRLETRYNPAMQLAIFSLRLLETMFFVGLAGSAAVVLLCFIEDGRKLFGEDEPTPPRG